MNATTRPTLEVVDVPPHENRRWEEVMMQFRRLARRARRGQASVHLDRLRWTLDQYRLDKDFEALAREVSRCARAPLAFLDPGLWDRTVADAGAVVATRKIQAAAGAVPNSQPLPETLDDQDCERSERTLVDYAAIYRGYRDRNQVPWTRTSRPQTVRTRYAALRVTLRAIIEYDLEVMRNECGMYDRDDITRAIIECRQTLCAWRRLERGVHAWHEARRRREPGTTADAYPGRKGSKRGGVRRFDRPTQSAEDAVFAQVALRRHVDAGAVIIVFGLRPAEVALGVTVTYTNGSLAATIRGAKVTLRQGQPTRELAVEPVNAAARYLVSRCVEKEGTLLVSAPSAKAACDLIGRAGRAAFPRAKNPPTAYAFRHELAADLRSSGDPIETAYALGHASLRTQSGYGTYRRKGRAGRNPVLGATASRHLELSDRIRPRPRLAVANHARPALKPKP